MIHKFQEGTINTCMYLFSYVNSEKYDYTI